MHKHRTPEQVQISDLVGARIKHTRDGIGWSRVRLATECQARGYEWLNYLTLTQIERNARPSGLRRNLTVDELFAIAATLGVPAQEFLCPPIQFERHHFFDLGWRRREEAR